VTSCDAQIGAVTFGPSATVRWNLNTYSTGTAVISAIQDDSTFPAGTGDRSLSGGLRTACGQMFQQSVGGRPGVPRIVIVVTAGYANINTTDTIPAAQACWGAGVRVYIIGITSNIDETQLTSVSSPPQTANQNNWFATDFSTLQSVFPSVQNSTCFQPKPILQGRYQ